MKFSKAILACVLGVLFPVIVFMPVVDAQTVVTIAPVNYQLSLDPGQKTTLTFSVHNPNTSTANVTTQYVDFKPEPEGEPQLLFSSSSNYSLKSWLSPIGAFSISPDGTDNISTTLSVPQTAANKTYYGSVVFSMDNQTVSTAVAALVLLNVGNPVYSGSIASIDTSQLKLNSKGQETGQIFLTIENTGNYMFVPSIALQISSRNGTPVQTINPKSNGNVLPKSERIYKINLKTALNPTQDYTVKPIITLPNHKVIAAKSVAIPSLVNKLPPITKNTKQSKTAASNNKLPFYVLPAAILFLLILTIIFLLRRHRHRSSAITQPANNLNQAPISSATPQNSPQVFYPENTPHPQDPTQAKQG